MAQMSQEREKPRDQREGREGWESLRITPAGGGPAIEIPMRPKTPEMIAADERFVAKALGEVGKAMSRQMEPGDIAHKLLDPKNLRGDSRIADMLAGIEDNFPQIKIENEEGIAELGANFAARVETAKAETKNPKTLGRLEEFKDKYLGRIAKVITHAAAVTRRDFLKIITLGGAATVLAACAPGVVGPAPTTTDSGPGRATATASATEAPTQTATPTNIPTETPVPATATPEGPNVEYKNVDITEYKVSQDVKEPDKLPHDAIKHFTGENNQLFASWVRVAENAGLFPDVPDTAEPFDSISQPTDAFMNRMGKYGLVGMFQIDAKYKDPAKRPWVVAAAWKLDDMGIDSYLVLVKYKNKNGTYGYIAYVFQPSSGEGEKINNSYDWELAHDFPGSDTKNALGGFIFVTTPTVNGCNRWVNEYVQKPANRICKWYDNEDPAIKYPKEILDRWQETGILTNWETIQDGTVAPVIPVVPKGGSTPGELFSS